MKSLILAVSLVAVAGCRSEAPKPDPAPAPASAPVAPAPAEPPKTAGPHAALDALDGRKPVPLLPMMAHHQKQNMRDHLVAVQEIVAALAKDDFDAAAKAAGRIGFSEKMGMMCQHMGAGAPGFTERALAFHHSADGITKAAHEKDRAATLRALGDTLSTCTSCHATYKQAIVDEAGYAAASGSAAPAMPHHGPHP